MVFKVVGVKSCNVIKVRYLEDSDEILKKTAKKIFEGIDGLQNTSFGSEQYVDVFVDKSQNKLHLFLGSASLHIKKSTIIDLLKKTPQECKKFFFSTIKDYTSHIGYKSVNV